MRGTNLWAPNPTGGCAEPGSRSIDGEVGQSLGVRLSGPKAGLWKDFATGGCGDPLDLIQAVRNTNKAGAIQWTKEWLGITGDLSAVRTHAPGNRRRESGDTEVDDLRRIAYAGDLWCQVKSAAGTAVETYLRGRAITLTIPPTIKYLSMAKHTPTGLNLPVMLAAVQGPNRKITGVHRTYLTIDGSGKAPVSKPKMMFGKVAGGAVRLARHGPELAIGEGIESCLSYLQATGTPTWAALSATNIPVVGIPSDVETVVLLADGDQAGEDAVKKVARKLSRQGRRVRIVRPPIGQDFNDVLMTSAPRSTENG